MLRGATLAADEASKANGKSFNVRVTRSLLNAERLSAAITSTATVGLLTVGGADVLAATRTQVDAAGVPIVEMADDLYDAGRLGASTFEGATPHSWQAWRLARYFGPADRKYSRIGLMREPGLAGESAMHALREFCADRGLEFLDATGSVESAYQTLASKKPQVVVIEGSKKFIGDALAKLSRDNAYQGRSKIEDGWRPQVAGFESMFSVGPVSGMVAAGDYGRPANLGDRMENVARFRSSFAAKFKVPPVGEESVAYDAVMLLVGALTKAGPSIPIDRPKLVTAIESTDRVRFARLPISLGPTDHVIPERDFLGLWAAEQDRWDLLMRTFTADLERTNIYDQDWMYFFSGSTPGGEAPFYNTARSGIVTGPSDDLR